MLEFEKKTYIFGSEDNNCFIVRYFKSRSLNNNEYKKMSAKSMQKLFELLVAARLSSALEHVGL